MSLTKRIAPALAAVLVAAAFVVFCIFAPVVYAVDTTSTTVNDSLDDLAAHYALNNVDIQSAAFAVIQHGDFYITYYWLNPTISVSGDTTTVHGSRRSRTFNTSNGKVSYDSYVADMSYTANKDYITVQRTSSFGTNYNYYFSGSDTRACYGYGIPNEPLNSMVEAIPKILNDKLSSGLYGFGASLPVLSSAVPATDYYNSHVKPAVNAGTDPVTTTTTTTTTTTSTTTITGVTLPPYPYETSPRLLCRTIGRLTIARQLPFLMSITSRLQSISSRQKFQKRLCPAWAFGLLFSLIFGSSFI